MHCSTTCGAFKVTEKFPMDAPLVNGKEIAVELRAVCKEARQRKTREDDDRRRGGERERGPKPRSRPAPGIRHINL